MRRKNERNKYGEPLSRLARLQRAAQMPLLLPIEPPPYPGESEWLVTAVEGTDGKWHEVSTGERVWIHERWAQPNSGIRPVAWGESWKQS